MQITDRIPKVNTGKNLLYAYRNEITAFAAVVIMALLIALRFDFYYDLNDDMLIKDITAGVYTGMPDGHNIQMLYPIGAFISLFYQLNSNIPWYAVFFIVCHLLAAHMIITDSLKYFRKTSAKLVAAAIAVFFMISLLLYYFVFVQYTVTAAWLGGAAAFRLYTTDRTLPWGKFVRRNIISVILVILAFQIRTEGLLLIFPLICVAALCKWGNEKKILCQENFLKYFTLLALILAGMGCSIAANAAAYGSSGWKEFNRFFDARTELYDFLGGAPSYEENAVFYESLGLKKSEQELLLNYNFGIDDRIDSKMLESIVDYGKELRSAENLHFLVRIKRNVDYNRDFILGKNLAVPWYQLIAAMYILLAALSFYKKECSFLFKIPLLITARSGLWLYLIYRGRVVERVSTCLYLVEFLILMVFLLELCNRSKVNVKAAQKSSGVNTVLLFAAAVLSLYLSGGTFARVTTEYNRREDVNKDYLSLMEYCRENSNSFYFMDVYSTVAYSEKMFREADNKLRNHDYLGGWANKSPLTQEKLKAFGMDGIQSGILDKEDVYIISHINRSLAWLETYLSDKGIPASIEHVDSVMNAGEAVFNVYRVH